MKAIYKAQKKVSVFSEKGEQQKPLPVGLLVEPVGFSTCDVVVKDLCNGVLFTIPRSLFENSFEPF